MTKRNSKKISRKNLSIALFIGLLIQFVLPQIKLGEFVWLSTLIYLIVALILFFM